MKLRRIAYWVTTVLTAFVFVSSGVVYVTRPDAMMAGMKELGYPTYFATILTVWKVLGGLAILAPRTPRLKEWAYAGMIFDLTGAAASHYAIGHPAGKVVAPLIICGIVMASWALRPESRKLRDASANEVESSPPALSEARFEMSR